MKKLSIRKKVFRLVSSLILVGIVGTLVYNVWARLFEVSKDVLLVKTNIVGTINNYFRTTPAKVSEDVPVVKTNTVQFATTTVKNLYSGEVRGIYESPLSFQVSGKVIRRNINPGSIVHSGDELLAIDTKDIEQTVNIASAQLDTANSKLKLAEITFNRNRELLKAGAISQEAYDLCQNDYVSTQAAVRLASAQYNQSLNQLNYCSLHADRDGVITAVNIEIGQVVATGAPAVMLCGDQEVVITVPENQVGAIKQAKSIKVSFWALPNITLDGKIREVSPSADPITRTYEVKVSLVNPPSSVKLGMTATADVAGSSNDKSVYIPVSAIYQTEDTPNVWVLQKDIVTLRPIKLGSYGDNTVEVLEGLKVGDIIVTAGVHKLQKEQKVTKAGDQQ